MVGIDLTLRQAQGEVIIGLVLSLSKDEFLVSGGECDDAQIFRHRRHSR
jgi:hypothetical protein